MSGEGKTASSGRVVDRLLVALAAGLVAFVGYHLLRRGVNLSDEGFLLQQAVDMLAGKILYRDIEMFIAPGIWFLVAGLFEIVEPSVLASRAIAAASYFAPPAVIFQLVRAQVGGRAGARAGAICIAVGSARAFIPQRC